MRGELFTIKFKKLLFSLLYNCTETILLILEPKEIEMPMFSKRQFIIVRHKKEKKFAIDLIYSSTPFTIFLVFIERISF